MSRFGPVAAVEALAATADPAMIGPRLNRFASYGTIDHAARSTSAIAATLRPRVTDGSEPRARIAYMMATSTTAAQTASCVRSRAPNEVRPGETCPYA